MRKRLLKGAVRALMLLLGVLPQPALIAPHVSADPIAWAYKVYHPFMYRYPHYFSAVVLRPATTLDLEEQSPPGRSLQVLRLMVKHW